MDSLLEEPVVLIPDSGLWTLDSGKLYRFFVLPGADAPRANADLSDTAVLTYPDRLKIGKESAPGFVMGVAYVVPHSGSLPAKIACP